MRRVSHSPTESPSRRADVLAASRASGAMPATFQGRSGCIVVAIGRDWARKGLNSHISRERQLRLGRPGIVYEPG
jgi:hypothetical protein